MVHPQQAARRPFHAEPYEACVFGFERFLCDRQRFCPLPRSAVACARGDGGCSRQRPARQDRPPPVSPRQNVQPYRGHGGADTAPPSGAVVAIDVVDVGGPVELKFGLAVEPRWPGEGRKIRPQVMSLGACAAATGARWDSGRNWMSQLMRNLERLLPHLPAVIRSSADQL